MDKLIYTLKIIFINRYRQLTYKDQSAFWIPIIGYFILIFKIINGSFPTFPALDLTSYFVMIFVFSSSQFINNRNDHALLKSLFPTKTIYFLFFLEIILVNTFNIIALIVLKNYTFLCYSFIIFLFFTFYFQKDNQPKIKLPFKILDVLTIVNYRRFKINYLVLIGIYYVSYQGLIESNRNLFLGCVLAIIIISFFNVQKTEKLDYFILSKLTNKQYILRNELDFFMNCLLLISPCLVLSLFFQINYFLFGLIGLLIIPSLFPLKYILLNYSLPLTMSSSLIIFIFLAGILNDEIDWIILICFVLIAFILHIISFRKFTKEKISSNSEFYL